MKEHHSYRLSSKCCSEIKSLATKFGMSQPNIIELAIDRMAKEEKMINTNLTQTILFKTEEEVRALDLNDENFGAFDDNGDLPNGNVLMPQIRLSLEDTAGAGQLVNAFYLTDEEIANMFKRLDVLELKRRDDDADAFENAITECLSDNGFVYSYYTANGIWVISKA